MALKIILSLSALSGRAYAPYPEPPNAAGSVEEPGRRSSISLLETQSNVALALTNSKRQLAESVDRLQAAFTEQHAVRAKQAKAMQKHRREAKRYAKTAKEMMTAAQARMRNVATAEAELRLNRRPSNRGAKKPKAVYAHVASSPSGAVELSAHRHVAKETAEETADQPHDLDFDQLMEDDDELDGGLNDFTQGDEAEAKPPKEPEEEVDDAEMNAAIPSDSEKETSTSQSPAAQTPPAVDDDDDGGDPAPSSPCDLVVKKIMQMCKIEDKTPGVKALGLLKTCTMELKKVAECAEKAHSKSTISNKNYVGEFREITSMITDLEKINLMEESFDKDHERVQTLLKDKVETLLPGPINDLLTPK